MYNIFDISKINGESDAQESGYACLIYPYNSVNQGAVTERLCQSRFQDFCIEVVGVGVQ